MNATFRLLLVVLCWCSALQSGAQGFSLETPASLAEAIARDNSYVISHTVGFAAQPSPQFQRYQRLQAVASDNELLELAETHGNPVVRLYAYQALKAKDLSIPAAVQRRLDEDRTSVHVVEGCKLYKGLVQQLAKRPLAAPAAGGGTFQISQ